MRLVGQNVRKQRQGYIEAEIERDLGPELEKQFTNQIGSCGVYNPHFSP